MAAKHTIETRGEIALVTLAYDQLDAYRVEDFKRQMRPVFARYKKIVFDMSRLRFIDSLGLGVVLFFLRELNAQGGDLKLCGLKGTVRMLLERVGMMRLFDIYETREDALLATQWDCPWKSLDIVLAPTDSIRRKAMALDIDRSAA